MQIKHDCFLWVLNYETLSTNSYPLAVQREMSTDTVYLCIDNRTTMIACIIWHILLNFGKWKENVNATHSTNKTHNKNFFP